MAEWQPAATALDFAPDNGGIVILWHSADIMNESPWRTTGVYGEDLFYYFIVPAGFTMTGENEFTYNFGLEYVNESVAVTGVVYHGGRHDLQQGKTEPFWHLKQSAPTKVALETDNKTKLPFLRVPSRGLPSFNPEVRYFIPLPETV